MTDRLERIERRLDMIEGEQRTHLRWLFGSFVGLVGLVVTSTGFLLNRIDRIEVRLEDKVNGVEARLGRLEVSVNALPAQVNQNLMQLTQTLAQSILAAQRPAPPPLPPQDQK